MGTLSQWTSVCLVAVVYSALQVALGSRWFHWSKGPLAARALYVSSAVLVGIAAGMLSVFRLSAFHGALAILLIAVSMGAGIFIRLYRRTDRPAKQP